MRLDSKKIMILIKKLFDRIDEYNNPQHIERNFRYVGKENLNMIRETLEQTFIVKYTEKNCTTSEVKRYS
jgi:hypothetical protein